MTPDDMIVYPTAASNPAPAVPVDSSPLVDPSILLPAPIPPVLHRSTPTILPPDRYGYGNHS